MTPFRWSCVLAVLGAATGCGRETPEAGGDVPAPVRAAEASALEELEPVRSAEDNWPWWRGPNRDNVASMVLADGLLYMVEDGGEATCFEAATGEVVWQTELEGKFSSSPVLAGGHVYVANEAGLVHVFKVGREFEAVAQNDLADGGFASPVVCGGRVYLRTLHHLYCLGE